MNGLYLEGEPFAPFLTLAPSARAGDTILLYAADRPDVQDAIRATSERLPR